MNLADNLQIHRKRMGLSQEELAERCQVSRQAIAKWENGGSVPTIEKLIFLADFYKVTLDELVGRKDDIALFEEFIKRYVPTDIEFGEKGDILPVINRFLLFLDKHGFSAEDKLNGIMEVLLSEEDTVSEY